MLWNSKDPNWSLLPFKEWYLFPSFLITETKSCSLSCYGGKDLDCEEQRDSYHKYYINISLQKKKNQ